MALNSVIHPLFPAQSTRNERRTAGRIPLLRPLLPTFDQLEPWLRRIDENRYYSNGGPLEIELRSKLADHFKLRDRQHISLVANATLGLMLAFELAKAKSGGKCLMPSWTFSATGQAALWTGLDPYFVDIHRETGMMDVDRCYEAVERLGKDAISLVVPVSYLGTPVDVDAWIAFRRKTGIPVVIDAAAGFDCNTGSELPTVVSLHATKSFSTGEGGCIFCDDETFVAKIEQMRNFGFTADRDVVVEGMNAKLSEFNAAIGLAFLDMWDEYRNLVQAKLLYLNAGVEQKAGARPLRGIGKDWVASMYAVDLPDRNNVAVRKRLAEAGVESKVWWEDGMHAKSRFRAFDHGPLDSTEDIAASSIGLPFFPDISYEDLDYVSDELGKAVQAG